MDEDAIARAKERLEAAAAGRSDPAEVEAALERAREGVEALAALAAELESSLPDRVENAITDSVRDQVVPVGRNIAEVRGLMNQMIRRLERLEGDTLSERHARVDDLALLVDLITSGWKGVDERLAQLEQNLQASGGAIVYRIEEHRPDTTAGTSS